MRIKLNLMIKCLELYKKMFRQTKIEKVDKWKDVYIMLIKCYKNICNDNIIITDKKSVREKDKVKTEMIYNINVDYLKHNLKLIGLKPNNLKHIKKDILNKAGIKYEDTLQVAKLNNNNSMIDYEFSEDDDN